MLIGLSMVPVSVYQMIKGTVVVFTAIESRLVLKRKLYRHHITAIIFIMIGVFQVGLVDVLRESYGGGGNQIAGIIFITVA